MADYISRDRLIERLGRNLAACNPGTFSEGCYADAIETIRNFPAADVVPVVRCRECKWARSNLHESCCARHCGLVMISPDSFCSYGEREED